MTQISFARGLLAATAISSFVVAGHASAQESGGVAGTAPASTGENVIIVTATKSGQSLEDTAAAISVLGADDVGAGGIEDALPRIDLLLLGNLDDLGKAQRVILPEVAMRVDVLRDPGGIEFRQKGQVLAKLRVGDQQISQGKGDGDSKSDCESQARDDASDPVA